MKEFLTSSTFLWVAIGLVTVIGVFALLWRNTVWEARGITPAEDVERLRTRLTGFLPKSVIVRRVIVGVIVLIIVVMWGVWGTHGTLSRSLQSPSLETVGETAKNYWLWILIVGGAIWVFLSFIPKEKEPLAKKLQWVLVAAMVILFIGAPVGGWFMSPSAPDSKVASSPAEIPVVSSRPSEWKQWEWPKLVIPAGGRSELIPAKQGKLVYMDGVGFTSHTVYRDGTDCAFSGTPCPNGDVIGVYATNELSTTNIVSYAYQLIVN
jgi:hypothetical protein